MSGDLSFREYSKKDLERCIDMTVQSWPELKLGGFDIATMDWYGWLATWKQLACVDDKPVGLLFGRIYRDTGAIGNAKVPLAHAVVYTKILLGMYGKTPRKLKSIKESIVGDKDIDKNTPDVDGEITFFVVDSAHRGKGIGRELLSRFVEHARSRGAGKIAVYTSEPGSDLRFYERNGFTRYSTFRDAFMSVIRNEEVKAMFYVLEVGPRAGH